MPLKKLDSFKDLITLSDVLNIFKNKTIFVEISNHPCVSGLYDDYCFEIIVDETEDMDVGFFYGRNCETTISSKSVCKIIDKDAVKIIDNNEKCNIGMILRFKSLETLNLF